MYDVALTVAACLRAGTHVDVAWMVGTEPDGLSPNATEAVVLTPGGGRVGTLCGGALDTQLVERAATAGSGRLLNLEISELEAAAAGLLSGGRVQCLLVPAAELPESLWGLLADRAAVCLVTRVSDSAVVQTRLVTAADMDTEEPEVAGLWARGVSGTSVSADQVVTVLRPVTTMVVAGRGPVAEALIQLGPQLGWRTRHAPDPPTATGLVVGLGPPDKVVVAMHDDEQAGQVLAAALAGRAGYLAALGSRSKRASREVWLAEHGVTGVERIRTPAGLDIGAAAPTEVAIAIIAEAIAVGAADRKD
jgi:xanthine dehydrogenase accessory factor